MPAPILVVDDDEDLQQLLRLVLEGQGYSVETASNGEEALACFERRRPGVILLDMRMPVMNGWEFAAALRPWSRPSHERPKRNHGGGA